MGHRPHRWSEQRSHHQAALAILTVTPPPPSMPKAKFVLVARTDKDDMECDLTLECADRWSGRQDEAEELIQRASEELAESRQG